MIERPKLLTYITPYDFDPEVEPALDRAIFFAKEMGAPLELFTHCGQFPLAWSSVYNRTKSVDKREELRQTTLWLEQTAEPLLAEGLNVCTDVIWSRHQYDAVMQKVAKTRPGLMIKSSGNANGTRQTLLNATDWHLIRDCPCPLLLANGDSRWETRRIVACVDPAHIHSRAETLDNVIIETGRLLAYRLRSKLHIFHSIEDLPAFTEVPNDRCKRTHQIYENHRQLLDELLKYYGFPDSRIHIVAGDPVNTLPPFIEQCEASLVMMGAVAKGPFKWLFIGNTAEKVLNRIACDVLIVKSNPIEAKVSEQIRFAFG